MEAACERSAAAGSVISGAAALPTCTTRPTARARRARRAAARRRACRARHRTVQGLGQTFRRRQSRRRHRLRARASVSRPFSLRAAPTIRPAPSARAACTAIWPTAPLEPSTRTDSPSRRRATRVRDPCGEPGGAERHRGAVVDRVGELDQRPSGTSVRSAKLPERCLGGGEVSADAFRRAPHAFAPDHRRYAHRHVELSAGERELDRVHPGREHLDDDRASDACGASNSPTRGTVPSLSRMAAFMGFSLLEKGLGTSTDGGVRRSGCAGVPRPVISPSTMSPGPRQRLPGGGVARGGIRSAARRQA